MALPTMQQLARNSVAKNQSRTCTATFNHPTGQGNLVVVIAEVGGGKVSVTGPIGFTLIRTIDDTNIQLSMWYMENAPPLTAVNVTMGGNRSLQVQALEYSGIKQSGSLDQVTVRNEDGYYVHTGNTNNTSQADSLVVAAIANSYPSCSQSGFDGGLIRLVESVSPQNYNLNGTKYNEDSDRTRITIHHLVTNVTASYFISANLSSEREWASILAVFKGGSSGPKQLSSKGPTTKKCLSTGGSGVLWAFGPIASHSTVSTCNSGDFGQATILPFNYQYRVGTGQGTLIGSDTIYNVSSTDGIGGWQVRTSDSDLPRGDGALRGVDLESARQMIFTIVVTGGAFAVEQGLDSLYRILIPQRDADWPLIWRYPGQAAKMMFVRPIDIVRARSASSHSYTTQKFALRAADPRHYSAAPKHIAIPNTPANALTPINTNVTNLGNIPAYPKITIMGPTSGPPVTRIQLFNATSLITFDVSITLPKGSVLVGDMQARITGAPRSIITLDGQSCYGSWNLPRDAFRIEADPTGQASYNVMYLKTTPAGAPVVCTLDYNDTWSG